MIVDCFPFFDELDLLEIRLNELKNIVDVFVLTESTHTFTGIEKPLYFADNKERFKGFNIKHSIFVPKSKYRPGEYERLQKQFNIDHAQRLMKPGDVMILGDCDEIPRASVIKEALKDDWESAGLALTLFYYYLNCRCTKKRERRDSRLLRPTNRVIFDLGQDEPVDIVYQDAGWHFSFFGDIQAKLKAYGHAPIYDKPPYNTPEHIKKCREEGLDLIGRVGKRRLAFEFITDDLSYLPQYVLDNMDRFKEHIK